MTTLTKDQVAELAKLLSAKEIKGDHIDMCDAFRGIIYNFEDSIDTELDDGDRKAVMAETVGYAFMNTNFSAEYKGAMLDPLKEALNIVGPFKFEIML